MNKKSTSTHPRASVFSSLRPFAKRTILAWIVVCALASAGWIALQERANIVPYADALKIPDTASHSGKILYNMARKQIGVVKTYDFGNGYYGNGGYPPDDTGVCTDVIWRAFRDMGIDLKSQIDRDMRKNPKQYGGNFDSNINFRRVKNQNIYFSRTAKSLTGTLTPNDTKNLVHWQAGDIVIFDQLPTSKLWHIGIITDKRRADGVPYMIDNHGYGTNIRITPLDWPTKIVAHYRVF